MLNVKTYRSIVKRWRWAVGTGVVLAMCLAIVPVVMEFYGGEPEKISPHNEVVEAFMVPAATPTPVVVSELTVEKILAWSRNLLESEIRDLPQDEVTQVMLGGDMMLGRAVNFNMHRKQDFGYPVAKIADKFKQADIAMVNLEAPILASCELTGEGMQLCSDFQSLYTLHFAGIDVVQLANNHILDYGLEGLEETKKWVNFQGIEETGLGEVAFKEVRGVRFGFLGFNQVWPMMDPVQNANEEDLIQEISKLKKEADVVIVGFHWGSEYTNIANGEQKNLARAAIIAGADLVWGQHPHWVQGVEIYEGKPIFYSLGNLVFDQMWSKETREGLVVELNFWKDHLVEARLLPVFMEDFSQPSWQVVGVGNVTLGKVEKISNSL